MFMCLNIEFSSTSHQNELTMKLIAKIPQNLHLKFSLEFRKRILNFMSDCRNTMEKLEYPRKGISACDQLYLKLMLKSNCILCVILNMSLWIVKKPSLFFLIVKFKSIWNNVFLMCFKLFTLQNIFNIEIKKD